MSDKFCLLRPFLIFLLTLSFVHVFSEKIYAKTIDLSGWDQWEDERYQNEIAKIALGDVVVLHREGRTISFVVHELLPPDQSGQLGKIFFSMDAGEEYVNKLGARAVIIPGAASFAELQNLYVYNRSWWSENTSVPVSELVPEGTMVPDVIRMKRTPFDFTFEEVIPLLNHNDASQIQEKRRRKNLPLYSAQEIKKIKVEAFRFVDKLARVAEVSDFAPNQIVYDKKANLFRLIDFLETPVLYTESAEPKKTAVDYWIEQGLVRLTPEVHERLTKRIHALRKRMESRSQCAFKMHLRQQPQSQPTQHL